jgi:F-type H+-transporting ATPase subunit gamma
VSHPLLTIPEKTNKVLVLVINANRGLCGGYNGGVQRMCMTKLKELQAAGTAFDLEAAGKRSIAFFKFQGYPRTREYTHFEDKPTFDQVDELATRYIDLFVSGQIDQLVVVYQKFQSISRQFPVVETLLPLSSVSVESKKPVAAGPAVDYEFLPSAQEILSELVPVAFKVRLFKCFLDAAVGEQIARRVAMKAATENASDLIKGVTRLYNRTRQANITKEISELIGGVEALK